MLVFEMDHDHWVVIARNTNAFFRQISGMKRGEYVEGIEGVFAAILMMIVHCRDERLCYGQCIQYD